MSGSRARHLAVMGGSSAKARGPREAGGAPGDDRPHDGSPDPDDSVVEDDPGAGAVPTPPPSRPPRAARFRSLVTGCPVVGFTGANGAGKTLIAVSEVIQDMRQGRPVYSTVPITSPWGDSHELRSLRQLLDLEEATVFIDEISVVFSSRASGSLPDDVVTFLQSMRHQRITLRWTAPAWARADLLVREVTQVVVGVQGLVKVRRPGVFWPRPRLVLAGALDSASIPVDARPEKVLGRRIWVPTRLPGWGAYDSEADVSRIGWVRQSGLCVDCGGVVPKERCSPERHQRLGIA